MSYKVDNAIIMAAGTSSRFAPLSLERHKALIDFRGEILIERQIKQIKEAGIKEVILVCGYRKEDFKYLENLFGVKIIYNEEYLLRNNNSSIYAAREFLNNSYVCSSDNYFEINPFETAVDDSYYAVMYGDGATGEWCVMEDSEGYITGATIGGADSWYMMGHTFWSEEFSRIFLSILEDEYNIPETTGLLWESIYLGHTDKLKMKARKYQEGDILEFDTLDDLRQYDNRYWNKSGCMILEKIARDLDCMESDITDISCMKGNGNEAEGFSFSCSGKKYEYLYMESALKEVI